MSQPTENNPPPPFNFIVDEPCFDDNQYSPPWPLTDPQTAQYSIPSPLQSVRSATTASNTRFPDASPGFNPSNLFQQQFGIDPSTPFLAPPGHISRESYNPLARHLREGPWNPLSMMNAGQGLHFQPNIDYGSFRDGHGIDMESVHDSGYGPSAYGSMSAKPTHSVISNEPECTNQELPRNVPFHFASMEIASAPSETPEMMRTQSGQVSNYNLQSSVRGKHMKCDLPECDQEFKCKSDHKKHMLKHEKPHRCDVLGCKRISGFTTTNDRDRHKKSVHRVGLLTDGKSYKCASKACRSKDKFWPRFDNFKQHVQRMHKGENCDDLIRRSLQCPAESAPVRDALSMSCTDNSLAFTGIGTESACTGSHQDGLVSPINVGGDQDVSRNSFGLIVDPSTTDIGQPSAQVHQSSPTTVDPRLRNVQEQVVSQSRSRVPQTRGESSRMREAAAKDAASKPAHVNDQNSKPHRRAPQTKADQQKLASQRASRTTTEGTQKPVSWLPDSVDIDDLVQLVLNQAKKAVGSEYDISSQKDERSTATQVPAEENGTATLTEDSVLQVLSGLLNQNSNSAFTLSRRSSQISSSKLEKCEKCNYEARPCDMRKHIKRHKKPYGCTFPGCHRRFGAKSDWKRHENSQHFQLEAFRCAHQFFPSGVKCGSYFRGPEQFKKHLETHSKLLFGKQLQDEVKRCKIGKNYQVQFWCGFCCEIKPLNEKRNAAWDERFNHIADHFDKEKKSIDEWVCVEKNRTKKELEKEKEEEEEDERKKNQLESDERTGDADAVGEIDDSPPPDAEMKIVPPPAAIVLPPQQTPHLGNSRKREASADPLPSRRKSMRVERLRYCCSCGNGPWNLIHLSCQLCGQPFCDSCEYVDNVPFQ